jgi:hypothetical protein
MIEKSSINFDLSLYLLSYSRCSHIKHFYNHWISQRWFHDLILHLLRQNWRNFYKLRSSNHLATADRMISYLYEIKNLVIEYSNKRSTNILLCVNDATFADDETTRKSSDDYLFQLYDDSIDWKAVKQATIIIFSTETELLTLTRIAKKAMWWRRFFEIIRFDSMKNLHIRCDNRQTLRILKKDVFKLDIKLKHVDIHRHWLRQKMQADRVHVSWVFTSEMFADDFIKILCRQKHEEFIRQLNLVDISAVLINQKKSAVSAIWAC